MNIYLFGMIVSIAVFVIISVVVSRKIKGAEDFYVAGRKAPVLLIAGSMIASYASTGLFMGDAATCYDGGFAAIVLFAGMQSAGYIVGAVFFGRYLRRSGAMTIPEFFGKRFHSVTLRKVAAITAIITMIVYLLSVIQGVGTLMAYVTGLSYNTCIIIAAVAFTFISIVSGSKGVLITDTMMAAIFTIAMIIATFVIAKNAGGWYDTVSSMAANPETAGFFSWTGKPGALYDNGIENMIWGLVYGVVWMSVCAIGPWQASRYQMAKNENTIVHSAVYAALGVFIVEFLAGIAAVMVNNVNPGMADSSHVLIWAATNLMPKVLGVVLLTGILSAGISSGTTFLSLVGASFANDIVGASEEKTVRVSRITMFIVSAVVLALGLLNSPAIFWVMYLGGAIIASSWMPVCFGAIFSRKMTKTAAIAGMIIGFVTCFGMKMCTAIGGIEFPAYFDPSLVGMVANVIILIVVSSMTKVTGDEKAEREALFIMPNNEYNEIQMDKSLKYAKQGLIVAALVSALIIIAWVIPYMKGVM